MSKLEILRCCQNSDLRSSTIGLSLLSVIEERRHVLGNCSPSALLYTDLQLASPAISLPTLTISFCIFKSSLQTQFKLRRKNSHVIAQPLSHQTFHFLCISCYSISVGFNRTNPFLSHRPFIQEGHEQPFLVLGGTGAKYMSYTCFLKHLLLFLISLTINSLLVELQDSVHFSTKNLLLVK